MKKSTKVIILAVLAILAVSVALAQVGEVLKLHKGANKASAATITVVDASYYHVTGTAQITSITARPAGTVLVLTHTSTDTVVDGSNLVLAGNFNATANDALILISDGTNWIELSRSAN